jgi:hypothetical protein
MGSAERYLEVVLRARTLLPELVESYRGPAELAERVGAEPVPSARQVRAEVDALQAELGSDGSLQPDRRTWMSQQLAGIDAALGYLEGERLGYRELVRRCYGVSPLVAPDSRFEAAHERLARALPGRGDVGARYQRWVLSQAVPPHRLAASLQMLAEELQRRTREIVALPAHEKVDFELVTGRWWAANADYQGRLRSRIQINQELPICSARLLELVSHEAYPGHHTEQVCKETALIQREGRVELAVYVYCTPQALIAEGIAMLALEALLGARADEVAAEVLGPLGVPYDTETAAVYREAMELLLPLRANLALMLDEGCPPSETRRYARRWMLDEDKEVDHTIASLKARSWLALESCYPEGLAVCRRFTGGDPARFKRLLEGQLTTTDLLAEPAP